MLLIAGFVGGMGVPEWPCVYESAKTFSRGREHGTYQFMRARASGFTPTKALRIIATRYHVSERVLR